MSIVRRFILVVLATVSAPAFGQIGFSESEPDRIRLWNTGQYEFAFRKSDGRLLHILDETTGGQVSTGNVAGPWVVRFEDGTWLDGANFSPSNGSRLFAYQWDPQGQVLTLTYQATGTYALNATLTIAPRSGSDVDTTLSITNQSTSDLELVAYPVHLSFLRSQIDSVYVPYMEGMQLLPNFFPTNDFGSRYPGQLFADFAYTDMSNGCFAVYGVHDPNAPLTPVQWLILRDNYADGVAKYHHDYTTDIQNGETWTSPTIVFNVGATLPEAMDDYWVRNRHDQMPTLEEKLGTGLKEQLARAVLLKADFPQAGWDFNNFVTFADELPPGSLMHLVAFWPVGFDENYPDYFPTNPALGTTAELISLVTQLQANGHVVMPYTNPTWWDDQSPTLANLTTDIVARNRDGSLIYETYNGPGGYVVSPCDADVIARQDQTRDEFTLTVPVDILFEDQVGARQFPTYDGHPDCNDPIGYVQGVLDVAARSASRLPIMSEGGYDRLSWHESGYCLSQTLQWYSYPSNTFRAYPMAPLWAHKNLYFNAHNLAGAEMATDRSRLTFFLAMGYALSHDLSLYDADWLKVLDCYQKEFVGARLGEGLLAFHNLPTIGQSETTYADGTLLTANLTPGTMTVDDHVVAPDGFVATQNGNVVAGVLREMHGVALSGSAPHYLALRHDPYRIRIFQPQGPAGNLTLPRPADWVEDTRILARAVTESGQSFGVAVTVSPSTVTVNYLNNVGGQETRYFQLLYCRAADSDCDGDIDADDFAALQGCLFGPDITPSGPNCLDSFDSDADLDVDMQDVAAFQLGFDGAL